MKRVLLFVMLWLSYVAAWPAHAQFFIESSLPVHGAANVPLQTTIRFEFSEEVDVTTDWDRAFVVEPADSVQLGAVSLLLDDEGRPAVIEWEVQHTPNTDFSWLVYAVQSREGDEMSEPYVLRYTTAGSLGSATLQGSIGGVAAKSGGIPATSKPALRYMAHRLEATARGRLPFPTQGRSTAADADQLPPASAPNLSLAPHTQVLLLNAFDVRESAWNVQAATVIAGATGDYTLEYLRDGTYWPLAVRYTDGTNRTIEALGFYDTNQDGEPDAVSIEGSDVTGVDLSMFTFEPVTSRARLDEARATAEAQEFRFQVLKLVQAGFGARPAGTAYAWSYVFYAGWEDTLTTVSLDPLNTVVETEPASFDLRIVEPLADDVFIDSDAATQIALDAGGQAFIDRFNPDQIRTVISGGNQHWLLPSYDPVQFWNIRFVGVSTTSTEAFAIRVDMTDGTVVNVATEAPSEVPRQTTLASNYPNPFRTRTTIPFHLTEAGTVTLSIYTLLGKRVSTPLADQTLPAGSHEITWEADKLASGIYLYRLETEGHTQHRTMLLVE